MPERHPSCPRPLLAPALACLAMLGAAPVAALVVAGAGPAPGIDAAHRPVERVAGELRRHPLRVDDPGIEAHLAELVCRLVPARCGSPEVHVLRRPGPQARILPGGALVLHTGLLLRVRDDDELAFVLAHELSHDRSDPREPPGAPTGTGARHAELSADAAAIALVAAAGFDATAPARLWRRLAAEEAVAGLRPGGSHPSAAARLAQMPAPAFTVSGSSALGQIRAGGEAAAGGDAWRAVRAPHLRRWLADEVRYGDSAATRAMLETALADATAAGDPGLRAELAYALAAHLRLHAGPGDMPGAPAEEARLAALHELAAGTPGGPPAAWRELGIARLEAGDTVGGAEALGRYLAQVPDAPDAAFVRARLGRMPAIPEGRPSGSTHRVLGMRLRSPARWTRHKGIGAEVWTVDGTTVDRLFVVAGVPAGEPMLRSIAPSAPRWSGGARPDVVADRLLQALHGLGWMDLAWTDLRPHAFGDVPGWRSALTAVASDGRRQRGEIAFAERDGRLTLLVWLAPDAPDRTAEAAAVAAMLDALTFAR